ncbi:CG7504 [Drosophila busckii]|uniref:CG7504 n=1 Tax=Drosophila busckii TaxID=30019 RepID=A0A0M5J0B6_DROBS|nr:probable helicase senataxin [Drosophila busckii]ALC43374.1 CG7504 [Drosophila busckii]
MAGLNYWFLEHLSTGIKLVLAGSDNTIGRHSSSKFVLVDYQFLSRIHARFSVNANNEVSVTVLNALNGVYVNTKPYKSGMSCVLNDRDIIGLGVHQPPGEPDSACPADFAIFRLLQHYTNASEILVLSSDEDDKQSHSTKPDLKLRGKLKEPKDDSKSADSDGKPESDKNPHSENSQPRCLHLPKLPDVKQELLSQATKDIENIFGEPNEELLESVLQINPYVFNQLNNNSNIPTAAEKICDGDTIDLPDDMPSAQPELLKNKNILNNNSKNEENIAISETLRRENNNINMDTAAEKISVDLSGAIIRPPEIKEIILDDEDYDENFAMSQALLREMKEELADDVRDDLSDNELDMDNAQPLQPWQIKAEIDTVNDDMMPIQVEEDELILVDDSDEEELNSKVADWSSRLLSQRIMSQIYAPEPEKEEDQQQPEAQQTPKISDGYNAPITIRHKCRAMRIESSSSSEEEATKITGSGFPQKLKFRKSNLHPKSINNEAEAIRGNKLESSTSTDESMPKEQIRRRPKTLTKEQSKAEEEVGSSSDETPKQTGQSPQKKCRSRKTTTSEYQEDSSSPESFQIPNRRKTIAVESLPENEETSRPKKTPSKQTSTSLRNRSQSVCDRSVLGNPAIPKRSPILIDAPHLTKGRRRNTFTKEQSSSKAEEEISARQTAQTPKKKWGRRKTTSEHQEDGSSPETYKIPNRRKTIAVENEETSSHEQTPVQTDKPTSTSLRNRSQSVCDRSPMLIDAPHLPSGRGKYRGVNATSKETMRRQQILSRQRSADYQAELKAKWYQKPSEEKKELANNKLKRLELLKKLSEKPKAPAASTCQEQSKAPAASTCQEQTKRRHTGVHALGTGNRGEFLTKDVIGPAPKKKKLETEPKSTTTSPQVETFSQQLQAADAALIRTTPATHAPRVTERKDAERARAQRTCNRVTFAEMDREFQLLENRDKESKSSRHVRFNNVPQIRIIERLPNTRHVRSNKDTKKLSLSTYPERREWALASGKMENFDRLSMGNILTWSNQWLQLGTVDAVAEKEKLMHIPTEFRSFKQYKDIITPLMKIEFLASIERDYKLSQTTFNVELKSYSKDDKNECYCLVTKTPKRPEKRFDLYTVSSGKNLKETFASHTHILRVGDGFELIFEIPQKDITMHMLHMAKTLSVRPVVDNLRVELGAFNAVYRLQRSLLFRRILKPSENVFYIEPKEAIGPTQYRGFTRLSEQQVDVCQRTWSRLIDDATPSITLIQGPPGTGKSAVIANLTLQCLYGACTPILDRKVLICAHSNAAVDNITQTLLNIRCLMAHNKFEVLRFGNFERMDAKVRCVSIEQHLILARAQKRNRLSAEQVMNLKEQQQLLRNELDELKQRAAQVSYVQQQVRNKKQQLRRVCDQLDPPITPREELELSQMLAKRANVVCTTLSSCVKLNRIVDYFDVCIVDEATQCTEPWTLLPLCFGVRGLVLVGDTQQLPATVLSQKAIDYGLAKSMFDRIQCNLRQYLDKPGVHKTVHTKLFKLSTQYRMHPEICRWPNSYFYEDQLVNADSTKRHLAPILPYCVINLSYTSETSNEQTRSISNDEEARFVSKLLQELDKHMPSQRFKYGLISPYSNHCYTLNQLIPPHMNIRPQTVDAYQGQERDIIILSNARTRGAGFLTNYQRLNVAITRPKRCLIICGNFDDLQSVDMWRHLLNDARQRHVYFDLQRSDVDNLEATLINKLLVKPISIDSDQDSDKQQRSKA